MYFLAFEYSHDLKEVKYSVWKVGRAFMAFNNLSDG